MNNQTLFGNIDIVEIAIKRLQTYEPKEGYFLAFSGGKDSIVIKKLADMGEVKYDAHYSVTTIDPPDLVRFIREHHKDVQFDYPEKSFFKLLEEKGFPLRQARWCCDLLKERNGAGRRIVTGIRWEESQQRSKRKTVEHCYKDESKIYINPIIDWTNEDVWNFIKEYKLPYCKLYDEGWKRIGCLLCPMAGKHRLVEAERYPKYTQAFKKAFIKLYDKRKAAGNISIDRWDNGEEMFIWWLYDIKTKNNPSQGVMFE